MRQTDELDNVLRAALAPDMTPDEGTTLHLMNAIKEQNQMKQYKKPALRAVLLAAALVIMLTASAYAAWTLLSPAEVATRLDHPALAAAFEAPGALIINESYTKGGYTVTLLGVASGKGLDTLTDDPLAPEETYAVVAITSDHPDTIDPHADIGQQASFFVSPLVKGVPPWQLNAATMHGGYASALLDGVLYRIVSCDSVEMFADRGLYLCVSDTTFFSVDAYTFDEETGEITPRPDYEGLNALFSLPLDPAMADRAKAAAYLEALSKPENDAEETPEMLADQMLLESFTPEDGELLANSVMTLTPDEKGFYVYTYENGMHAVVADTLFADGETGFSVERSMQSNGTDTYITLFHRDEAGTVTGQTYRVK